MKERKGTVTFNCGYCGKENTIPHSYYVRRKHHFCGRRCGFAWFSKQKEEQKKKNG